jgi:hypothetical protein
VKATGIFYSGPTGGTNVVSKNHIKNILLSSSNTSATIRGIDIKAGTSTYSNNIISLGSGLNTGYNIHGIYENGAASNNNSVYHNTVYLGGTPGSGSNTAAFYSNASTNTRNFRNNIFENARSNTAGSQKHYAAFFNYGVNTGLTLDYNNYFASGTGGVLGFYNSSDQAALPLVTGNDGNSVITNPQFLNAGGHEAEDYYPLNPQDGVVGTGITLDYLGITRGAPFMGALEAIVWMGSTSTDFNTASNWIPADVPSPGEAIVFHSNPVRSCLLDQARTLGSIANAQSTDILNLNNYTLTLTGSLLFSNDARIVANGSTSTLILNGTEEQVISGFGFEDNELMNLIVNNPNNALIQDTLKILGTLTKTAGAVDALSDSSNIQFTSLSVAQSIPDGFFLNNTLYDLTIDNSNHVSISSNIAVNGNLRFSLGELITGTDTLIINDGAGVAGYNASSFINGICRKVGDEAFEFPIGDVGVYAPISISAPTNITDAFTARYYKVDPITSYDDQSVGAGIDHISDHEYWDLDQTIGTSNVSATLSWEARSGVVNNLTDLRVAHWDGAQWIDEGNAGTTGNTSAGGITSNIVTSFSPFTLASATINNPLPIILTFFDAKKDEDNQVVLEWKTESEVNNDYFVIERSLDGINFKDYMWVKATGNSSIPEDYSLIDSLPFIGTSFYRLKQVDFDGKSSFSNIKAIHIEESEKISVYPIPAKDKINVQVNLSNPKIFIQIYDSKGTSAFSTKRQLSTEQSKMEIDVSSLSSGIYTLKLSSPDGNVFFKTIQVLKE